MTSRENAECLQGCFPPGISRQCARCGTSGIFWIPPSRPQERANGRTRDALHTPEKDVDEEPQEIGTQYQKKAVSVDVFLVSALREMVLRPCRRRLGTVSAPFLRACVRCSSLRTYGPFRREVSLMENETRHGSRAMLFSGSGRTTCSKYRCRLLQAYDPVAITF